MAFRDCDINEAGILDVQSVSDMISAFKAPAADAVKLIGGDDIAVFSPQLGLMAVTSQYDLSEPVATSQTVILSMADAERTWPDPLEYISDIVFECRWPSGARLVTEFQTFSDENATPSASLEYYRKRFAESGACTVFSGCDAKYLLDLKGKRDASRADIQDGTPVAGKRPADGKARPADLAHRAALADAQKAARESFPKQAELVEAEQRLAVLEQERIEAEAQRQREQAQRAEAEAAAIEEGVEEERAAEREHERAAVADVEAREAARVAELRRQGLICEDSAAHNAATASPNGVALGVPGDIAEAARCSAAASVRDEGAGGEKHKAGM